jgi:hypothetical protein
MDGKWDHPFCLLLYERENPVRDEGARPICISPTASIFITLLRVISTICHHVS